MSTSKRMGMFFIPIAATAMAVLFLFGKPSPILAQTEPEQLVRIQTRDTEGVPITTIPIRIVRHYDGRDFGELMTDLNGTATWALPIGYEYEIHLPAGWRIPDEIQDVLGDMGMNTIGFQLGDKGMLPQQEPVLIGLVLLPGSTVVFDNAPSAEQPEPEKTPTPSSPTAVPTSPTIEAVPATSSPSAADSSPTSDKPNYFWLVIGIIGVVIVTVVVLLWPVMKEI